MVLLSNQSKKDEITCIQLSKETRDKLAELGKKDDTFEDIVNRLISTSDGSEHFNKEVEE